MNRSNRKFCWILTFVMLVSMFAGVQVIAPQIVEAGATNLPTGWSAVDIGGTGGSVNYDASTGTFTITGSGSGIASGSSSDSFYYVYTNVSGVAAISARVQYVTPAASVNSNAKAGVMMRESTNADSVMTYSCVTAASDTSTSHYSLYRNTTSGTNSSSSAVAIASASPYLKNTKFVNSGKYWVNSQYSSDGGATYINRGTFKGPYPQSSYVGFAVATGCTVKIDNVKVWQTTADLGGNISPDAPAAPATASTYLTFDSTPSLYTVTGSFMGLSQTAAVQSITFTNISDGHTYNGTVSGGGYTARLGNGTYTLSATCSGNYEAAITHVVVSGSNTTKDVKFNPVNGWNLVKITSNDITAGNYKDLTLVNGTGRFWANGNSLAAAPGSSIVIPVVAGQLVTVSGFWSGEIYFSQNPANKLVIPYQSGYTSKLSYKATATGTLTLNMTGTQAAYLTAIDRVQTLDWAADIYVGDSSKPNNYSTVKGALAAAASMNPTSEAQRIKIHIAPGVYRAQLKIATPYITLMNSNPSQEVKITWYYGIGYQYYSAGTDGYYSEDYVFDRYEKHTAAKWGATVFLSGTAKEFKAENIVFENSFNRYVTDEEIADGVAVDNDPNTTITVARIKGLDVTARGTTERAAAMGIEADNVEFYNCKFLGSQDTLYTGNVETNSQYYKNCFIEGNTDYIYGGGNAVFDNCTLNFFGYSDVSAGGYITAANLSQYGYLFRNCRVAANANKLQASGNFGRPWAQSAKVTFLNTTLQNQSIITPQGWSNMGTNTVENANFYEYKTTYNGVQVDTSSRRGHVMTQSEADAINAANYFGDWTPQY